LELSAMMLDYYAYTGDKAFVTKTLLPMADAGVTFFDQHFQRDANGKLQLDPDNAIEMFWKVRNPLPDIAGLRYVLQLAYGEGHTHDQWSECVARSLSGDIPARWPKRSGSPDARLSIERCRGLRQHQEGVEGCVEGLRIVQIGDVARVRNRLEACVREKARQGA
jgi:hypothetical protein